MPSLASSVLWRSLFFWNLHQRICVFTVTGSQLEWAQGGSFLLLIWVSSQQQGDPLNQSQALSSLRTFSILKRPEVMSLYSSYYSV